MLKLLLFVMAGAAARVACQRTLGSRKYFSSGAL